MHIILKNWLLIILISLVAACSTTTPKNVIPDTGPTMLQIYNQHINSTDQQPRMYRRMLNGGRDLAGYTRTAGNEINLIFPRLPNPEIVMYVYPHFTRKNRPVPGYSTSFMMYAADKYALPGEIAPDEISND